MNNYLVDIVCHLHLGHSVSKFAFNDVLIFSFSALTLLVGDRKGIRPVKKMGVGCLVVTI